MKSFLLVLSMFSVFAILAGCINESEVIKHEFALAIHGGAGTILKSNMTDEKDKAYQDILSEVLNEGYRILNEGGSSLDAVQKCINIMEDSPLFNAGKGAVFTANGKNEMDAPIMEGRYLVMAKAIIEYHSYRTVFTMTIRAVGILMYCDAK